AWCAADPVSIYLAFRSRICGAALSRRTASGTRKLKHLPDPVVRIVGATVLNVDQRLAQPHGHRTGGAAADDEIATSRAHFADRRNDGGGAAGKRFLQLSARRILAPLVDRVGLLAHGRALVAQ